MHEPTGELGEGGDAGAAKHPWESRNQLLMDTWLSRRESTFALFTVGLLRTQSFGSFLLLFSTRFLFGKNIASRLTFFFDFIFFKRVSTRRYMLYLRKAQE